MTKLIPHPLLSLTLLLVWLLLTRFSLGQLVLGSAVALVAGGAMSTLEPEKTRLRRPLLLPGYALRILRDVLVSNYDVARLIVTNAPRRPGFVEVPLELQDRNALALLAIIFTAMPGTAWIEYDRARSVLTLHAFDLDGQQDWPGFIKQRYEKPLLEILG
ncbi:Na+/H+ antiporter subunit E [Cereibacter changlensis]|uniref:Na+/H+ antiporter subunit E n=1 Tax=Cereibacter changlensis TaxID=402884 RepID=A0A4U0Z069_9RHOB|nr:Na+/H+ antiporter subunit E [Cereibacter changlensis]TKA94793.1 Na+/H+ antiporter subunit E [Cereibacter changlensis]